MGQVDRIDELFEELQAERKRKIKSRQTANKKLLRLLEYYIDKYPDARFGQILLSCGFINADDSITFSEEPEDTLKHIKDDTAR
jgi:hypothetical protein